MTKSLTLSLLFILSFTALFAKTDYALKPSGASFDYCSFNKVEIVDARIYKDDLGYVKTGAFNAKNELIPVGGTEQMFKAFIEKTIQPAVKKDDKTLLMILRNYKITDRPVGGELGTFYVRASFYLGSEDHFQSVLEVDSFFETTDGWDVTRGVLNMANIKVNNWVLSVAQNRKSNEQHPYFSKKDILNKLNEIKPYTIYSSSPKNGIYRTEKDFLNNNPEELPLLCALNETKGDTYKVYKQNEKGKFKTSVDDEDWFAVFSNGNWYKKTEAGIFKMTFSNNDFYFPHPGIGLRANDDMAIMFGMLGHLIANGANGNVFYNMRYNPETGGGQAVSRLQ